MSASPSIPRRFRSPEPGPCPPSWGGGAGRSLGHWDGSSMRHELTWEMQGSGRSVAATVYERGVMALALVLPVPLLAAAGLSMPLPDGVYRLGVAAVERTAAVASALPSIHREKPAPTE